MGTKFKLGFEEQDPFHCFGWNCYCSLVTF